VEAPLGRRVAAAKVFAPVLISKPYPYHPHLGRVAGSAYTVSLYPNPAAPLIPLYPKSPVGRTGSGKVSPAPTVVARQPFLEQLAVERGVGGERRLLAQRVPCARAHRRE
jgi:hypothetical protein